MPPRSGRTSRKRHLGYSLKYPVQRPQRIANQRRLDNLTSALVAYEASVWAHEIEARPKGPTPALSSTHARRPLLSDAQIRLVRVRVGLPKQTRRSVTSRRTAPSGCVYWDNAEGRRDGLRTGRRRPLVPLRLCEGLHVEMPITARATHTQSAAWNSVREFMSFLHQHSRASEKRQAIAGQWD